MERHSVPQNIMDVEFKLFGAFSVRQFAYLAGGVVIALLIYFTKFPFLLKSVLIIFSVISGLFLAVVKINGQSSSVFVSNFIMAMLTSQERIWRKTAIAPEVLKAPDVVSADIDEQVVSKIRKSSVQNTYLPAEVPLRGVSFTPPRTAADDFEEERLKQIDQHFNFAIQELNDPKQGSSVMRTEVTPPAPQPAARAAPPPNTLNIEANLAGNIRQVNPEPVLSSAQYSATINPMHTEVNRAVGQTDAESQNTMPIQQSAPDPNEQEQENDQHSYHAFPDRIAGVVFNNKDQIIPNAEVNVKDLKGMLIRRVATDSKGFFILNNPLPNGTYYIDITAQGYKFNRYKVILNGELLPLYKFKAK